MKKNYRALTVLLGTSILAGALTGCGGMKKESATAPMAREDYAVCTETACEEIEGEYEAPLTSAKGIDEFFAPERDCLTYVIPNTEEYDKPSENGFFLSQAQPLSTFAADVDTASYANIRRMIENGYSAGDITTEAVRPEEFLNYFSYDLKSPKKGEKFGITTEVSKCPWNEDHDLMFVGIKAKDVLDGQMPKSNLVFLIDVSGSMDDENKLYLLKKSFKELVDNYKGEGTVSIVTYASEEEVVLDGVSLSDKRTIKKAIDSLYASGSTNGERGMEMAYEVAMENFIEGGNNRVIMATDGDLNVGISDPDELERFIEKKKDSGVFLSVLGFGEGNYKDNRLERLADCGNGNYSYIDSMLEARKVLVEEMTSTLVTVAKDVKFQIEFNPAVVNGYRLIGYENRQMDAVDFNNDKKDGGELGSGHTVVALYEIIPADSDSSIELKYQDAPKGGSSEYATLKLRYKEPEEDSSKLLTVAISDEAYSEHPSENLFFASLVSEFAMLLSDSDYSGDVTYKDIMKAYKELDTTDEYKDEFYNLVRMMEKRG
ncbi:MAG: VWA domain-containing protein [Butyrivibrio sp.]|nr:VWA domain-containing protein [Butyrivibrio sp.]